MANKKPICKYGNKCYRKNQKHLQAYEHPSENSVCTEKDGKKEKNTKDQKAPERQDLTRGKKESSNGNKRKNGHHAEKETVEVKKAKTSEELDADTNEGSKDESSSDDSDSCDEKSQSWTYIKTPAEPEKLSDEDTLKGASKQEIIKYYYLVDMPDDFYSFFNFCESTNKDEPLSVMKEFGLHLVGPFDILAGKDVKVSNKELMLCHWRHFYDPPEFQTVLNSDSRFHIGYWRDVPKEVPDFVASNNPSQDCLFKVEGENLFGAAHNYLTQYIKTCDPFSKTKAAKFKESLSKWAQDNKFTLEKSTSKIKARQRRVNSKTFHGAGIVVPVDKKTDVGYRPLIETDAKLKKLCQQIADAKDESERESLMEKLQPLITFANIANDECDFGNSLELGIDLFCMGSPVFHNAAEHLLTTAYSLLNRSEFGEIIKAHLKNRRNEANVSVL
ncbi:UNVERIFIED_CONTAM: hypothetical protein PYX00_005632 [Menopon gallinae]|uniref:PBZ-type domain-containing protein n=1 Tax=Menopon gallinae TaxID=328185 RepID=A0AAW2HS82_9NEOP